MDPTSYSENRKTEIEWLEEIPKHWDIRRLKFMATIQNGRDYKHVECNGNGYPVYGSGGAFRIASEYLYDGESILFGRKGTIDKPLYVQGKFWTVDTMFYSEVLPETYGKFLYYSALTIQYDLLATQTALPSITQLDLDNYSLCFPPFKEQQQIAKFLDHKTGQIDQLIAKKKALIEKLDEKRIAVITQVVTKGLDPTVPMRDSEVEWLGEVPEHWEVMKMSHIVRLKSGGSITSLQISPTGTFPVYGGNGQRGYFEAYTHEGEYVLIGRQGALCGNINYASGRFWASEHAVVVTPDRPLFTVWLGELLRVMNLGQYSVSAAQPGISVEQIARLKMPYPPVKEQERLADYISEEIGETQKMIDVTLKTIDRLTEYRTALITAAVTGKIDVRNIEILKAAYKA